MNKLKNLFVLIGFVSMLPFASAGAFEDFFAAARRDDESTVVKLALRGFDLNAVDEHGNIVGEGDAYAQTRFIINKAEKALVQLGAGLKNVVRTRMFVTDISQWEAIGRAHGEYFKHIKPAATMVEVKALIDPKLLVEIEFTAWVG